MELEILRKIGLTEGEIKVYSAIIELGKAPIFKVMKKSRVSSSKVYLILDKLIQKGLVSFSVKEGVKEFQATNPNSVIDYANEKKKDIENFNSEFEKLIPAINLKKGSFESESSQVYTGVKGISAAFINLLKEMNKGEEYYFFSITPDELTSKNMSLFFKNYHRKRIDKGVKVKGIVHYSINPRAIKDMLQENYKIKYSEMPFPTAVIIGKNRIIIPLFGENDMCYEIISKRIAGKYKTFFDNVWKKAR